MAERGELQSRLRAFHEQKKLAAIENALAPVSSGRSLPAQEPPAWVSAAMSGFWEAGTEPAAVIADDVEPTELTAWTEQQLARQGIGRDCYVATHLEARPWIGCTQAPGWTQLVRDAVPEPIVILADDFHAVMAFMELEYFHAAYCASRPS